MSSKLDRYFDDPAPSARAMILGGMKQALYTSVARTVTLVHNKPLATLFFLTGAVMASIIVTNATLHQKQQHPAPLFIMKTTQSKHEQNAPSAIPAQAPLPKPLPKNRTQEFKPPMMQIQRAHSDVQVPDQGMMNSAIQQELAALGFYRGKIDGKWGKQAEAALRAYQILSGIPETGMPTSEVLVTLRGGKADDLTTASIPQQQEQHVLAVPEVQPIVEQPQQVQPRRVFESAKIAPQGESAIPELANPWGASLTLAVEQRLAELGFQVGKVDGKFTTATQRAIEAFEKQHGMPVSGRINGRLLQEMTALTGSPLL